MNSEHTETTASGVEEKPTKLLDDIISEFDCVSGTLHREENGSLKLIAYQGIPDPVLARIKEIPIGKGMAGLAAQQEETVQICNLQTDDSGVAESRARDTGMEGSIAAPVFDSEGELKGTIGIAKPESYEFSAEERDKLMNTANKFSHLF